MHNRKRAITLKLTKHPSGYWCKKIGGKLEYFGLKGCPEADARKALVAYLHLKEHQHPQADRRDIPLHSLAAAYAQHYAGRIAAGHVQKRTWDDYDEAIADFVALVGPRTLVSQVTPADFSRVAGEWRVLSPARRGNYIQTIRSLFKWGKVDVDFGPDFKKPDRHEHRAARRRRGAREIPPEVLTACWAYATPRLRAWLLLGLNCGMYAKDISALKWRDIRQVQGEWCVDWTRGKTGITWVAPLWPETVAALPKRRRDEAPVFATKGGRPLVHGRTDEVARSFARLLNRLGMKAPGVAFGAVRHTHTTAVQDCGDTDAACVVRGHQIPGMAGIYDNVDRHIDRLKRVTEIARDRLYVAPSSIAIPPGVLDRLAARRPGRKPRGGQTPAPAGRGTPAALHT